MSQCIEIQSIGDVITNSSSEVFLVRPRDSRSKDFKTSEDIAEAIMQHAMEHRCPYTDWYLKEHPEKKALYNDCNNEDPSAYLETVTLLDAFRLYVLYVKEHGTTPYLYTRISTSWKNVTVDEMLRDLEEEAKFFHCQGGHLDKNSALVDIDHRMDKTRVAMFDVFDTYEIEFLPEWIDFLNNAIVKANIEACKRDPDHAPKYREVYEWCEQEYKRWLEGQEKDS